MSERVHKPALSEAPDMFASAPTRPEVVCTVAGPKRPFTREIYQGLELDHLSARPGAYAAFALPSIFSGKARLPTPSAHVAMLAEARRLKGLDRKPAYVARPGSVPAQVVAYLRGHGGHLTFGEVADVFAVPATSVSATLQPAITGGALCRLMINNRTAVALPGYTPAAS